MLTVGGGGVGEEGIDDQWSIILSILPRFTFCQSTEGGNEQSRSPTVNPGGGTSDNYAAPLSPCVARGYN